MRSQNTIKFFPLLLVLFSWTLSDAATPYVGDTVDYVQPDGTRDQVLLYGDQYYAVYESFDGYTLTPNEEGWLTYATLSEDGDKLLPTDVMYSPFTYRNSAQAAPPMETAQKKLRINSKKRDEIAKFNRQYKYSSLKPGGSAAAEDASKIRPRPVTGEVYGLTIVIEFPDVKASLTKEEVENFLNQEGYNQFNNNGSIRDYFLDVSHNKLDYINIVPEYYTAKNPKSYYTNPSKSLAREMITEALEDLDAKGFDFSKLSTRTSWNRKYIQAINVLYAGGVDNNWSEGLWPHQGYMGGDFTSSSGYNSGSYQVTSMGTNLRMYTFVHENGHLVMGWPDLYDYGGDSKGAGNFCLMGTGGSSSTNPVPPNAYLRHDGGWEEPTVLNDIAPGTILKDSANSLSSYVYQNPNNENEAFYIEAKTKTGRSASFPDQGLFIVHIDSEGSNNDQDMTPSKHYLISVEQADGKFSLEKNERGGGGSGDLFHKGDNDSFTDQTLPDAKWWDGSNSGLYIVDISEVGDVMTFQFGDGEIIYDLEFEMVDESGEKLHDLTDGAEFMQVLLPENININTIPNQAVDKIEFTVSGVTSSSNEATSTPYSAFDSPWATEVGELIITAKAYVEDEVKVEKSITINITDETPPEYTISTSASEGGSITPAGETTLYENQSLTITLTPDEGFVLDSLIVDGNSVNPTEEYTFEAITEDHALRAVFKEIDFKISFVNASSDEILFAIEDGATYTADQVPNPLNIDADPSVEIGMIRFILSGAEDYESKESIKPYAMFKDDNGDYENWELEVGSYTINMRLFHVNNDDNTLFAEKNISFEIVEEIVIPTYTITSSITGEGGSIDPEGETEVDEGDDLTFTISVEDEYEVEDVLVDGESVGTPSTYTFDSITDNHTIEAKIKEKQQGSVITPILGSNNTLDQNGIYHVMSQPVYVSIPEGRNSVQFYSLNGTLIREESLSGMNSKLMLNDLVDGTVILLFE